MRLNNSQKKGFTLIELLVSIGLFSVVLTIALGSMMTVSDSNKKARTLMSVMNNLNFAVDSMTRSFKTGEIGTLDVITEDSNTHCFKTEEKKGAQSQLVEYCWDKETNAITKAKGNNGTAVDLTSSDIEIQYASFEMYGGTSGEQPLLVIVLEGEVKITPTIRSKFTIHTSVAQRTLNI